MVTVLLGLLAGMLWWSLELREQVNLRNEVNAEARYLAGHLDTDLRTRIAALQRMAIRWEIQGGTPKEEFVSDAGAYVADMPGLQALEWVDRDFIVQWVVPLAGNERAQGLNLAFESRRRVALEKSRETRSPTMTAPVELVQGGKGFLVYVPLFVNNEFSGFFLAVFRLQSWMEHVIRISAHRHSLDDFRVVLAMDDARVFEQGGWADRENGGVEGVAPAEIMGRRFVVHLRPKQGYIEQAKTSLPRLALLIGGLLALLVGFIVHLLQKMIEETRKTRAAKNALEVEVRERQKAEGQLQQALSRLDMATNAGGIGVWSWDVATGVLIWSEHMHALYDIPADILPTYDTWRQAVHPEDLSATESLLQNAMAGRAVFDTEFRIIRSSGEIRFLAAAARVERDQDGAAVLVTGVNWDLTERKMAEETMKKSEEQVRLLLNSTAEAIYGIDLEGNCTFANPACLRILGYTYLGQVLGKNMHNLIHHSRPDGSPLAVTECRMSQALRQGQGVHRDDEVFWRANGTSFPAEYRSYPQIVNGEMTGAVVSFSDISERKQAEAMLARERQRLAYILEGTNVGTWEWNVQTGETVFNERWAEIIGYTLAEIVPLSIETWMRLAHPDDLAVSGELLKRHFAGELPYYEHEARMRHKDGDWVWVLDRGKVATWTDDGKPLMMFGTHQDITERKLTEEKVRHMATHDALTGLPSLRLAKDRLAMALSLARRNQSLTAVMFVDLDGFKGVNDTMGHEAGDYVLREVAQRMLASVREADTVARVGGDEFLVVASGLQEMENAGEIARKIILCVTQPIEFHGRLARVGASIGIALSPHHAKEMELLIKLADKAMYRVKHSGKNNFGYATLDADSEAAP